MSHIDLIDYGSILINYTSVWDNDFFFSEVSALIDY